MKRVLLDFSGSDGAWGTDGISYLKEADEGEDGKHGGDATIALSGQDGASVNVRLRSAGAQGSFIIECSGGFKTKRGLLSSNTVLSAADTMVDIKANGGSGGSGGDGGKGQKGGPGENGQDATKYNKATNGYSGGRGGDAGHGTSGADGGDGGNVTVSMDERDMHLALVVGEFVAIGGIGGRKGKHGEPGKGGSAGRGGKACSWVEEESYEDANGMTMTKRKSFSNPAGRDGKAGSDGRAAHTPLHDGKSGREGSRVIVVGNARYSAPFDARIKGFQIQSDFYGDCKFYEPGDFVVLKNFELYNPGGMPTPFYSQFLIQYTGPFVGGVNNGNLVLNGPSVPAGSSRVMSDSSTDRMQLPKSSLGGHGIYCSLVLPDAGREMHRFERTINISYPVALTPIRFGTGQGVSSFSFSVCNSSPRDFGASSETARSVSFTLAVTDGRDCLKYKKAYIRFQGKMHRLDSPISLEIPLIKANSRQSFMMELMVENDLSLSESISLSASLFLAEIRTGNVLRIEEQFASTRVSRCSVLLGKDQTHLALQRAYQSESYDFYLYSDRNFSNLQFCPSVYCAKVSEFKIESSAPVGSGYFYEPGDRIVLKNFGLKNVGDMETPPISQYPLSVHLACAPTSGEVEYMPLVLTSGVDRLKNGQKASVPGEIVMHAKHWGDHTKPEVWFSQEEISCVAHFPYAELDFEPGTLTKTVVFYHAVRFKKNAISFPNSVVPGSSVPFKATVENISPRSVGAKSDSGRAVQLRITATGDFSMDKMQFELCGQKYSLGKPVTIDLPSIDAASSLELDRMAFIHFQDDVSPYKKAHIQCDLLLQKLSGDPGSKEITIVQRQSFNVNISVPYTRRAGISCIMVSNIDTTSEEYSQWAAAMTSAFGSNWAVFDISLYNCFSLAKPVGIGGVHRSLLDDLKGGEGGVIIILNKKQESSSFKGHSATDFLDESDWISLKQQTPAVNMLIFGGDPSLRLDHVLIPLDEHQIQSALAQPLEFQKKKHLFQLLGGGEKETSNLSLEGMMSIQGKISESAFELSRKINQGSPRGSRIFTEPEQQQMVLLPTLKSIHGGRIFNLPDNDFDHSFLELLLITLPFDRKARFLVGTQHAEKGLNAVLSASLCYDLTEAVIFQWFSKRSESVLEDRLKLLTECFKVLDDEHDWVSRHAGNLQAILSCLATFWQRNFSKRGKFKAIKRVIEAHIKQLPKKGDNWKAFKKEVQVRIQSHQLYKETRAPLAAILQIQLESMDRCLDGKAKLQVHLGPTIQDKKPKYGPAHVSEIYAIMELKATRRVSGNKLCRSAQALSDSNEPPHYAVPFDKEE